MPSMSSALLMVMLMGQLSHWGPCGAGWGHMPGKMAGFTAVAPSKPVIHRPPSHPNRPLP
ncbi:DUF3309 family protein [Acidovorax sp. 106]|uniref:DUF3309 family protein n=1 Tax=Acidovorax sp. 106 TaxID=2135637 RepID=UPI000EB0BB81